MFSDEDYSYYNPKMSQTRCTIYVSHIGNMFFLCRYFLCLWSREIALYHSESTCQRRYISNRTDRVFVFFTLVAMRSGNNPCAENCQDLSVVGGSDVRCVDSISFAACAFPFLAAILALKAFSVLGLR